MTGKEVLKKLIVLLLLVFVFFLFQLRNPYLSAYFSSLYTIEQATITQRMLPTGEFEVEEEIVYRMRKPFRGVFREVPPSRYVEIEDVRVLTEGVSAEYLEWEYLTPRGFSVRVWLVPFGSAFRLDPRTYPRVVLRVAYRARYVYENGPSIAQVFRQFWGEWDSWASGVRSIFEFPKNVTIERIYTHPALRVTREGNRFVIFARHLPPRALAEVRFVAQPLSGLPYAALNPSLTLEDIEREEGFYRSEVRNALLFSLGLFGIFCVLLLLVFLRFGREPEVSYERLYEEEPPYDDPPDVVNAIVKNFGWSVDDDGIAAVLLHLYHLDLVDFAEEGKAIVLKGSAVPQNLPRTEKALFALLQRFSENGVFRFERLKEKLERSLKEAKGFNSALSSYRKEVGRELARRKYLRTTGNILAKVIAVFMVLASFGPLSVTDQPALAHLLPFFTVLSGMFFFTGAGVLLTRRDRFGSWSTEGRLYYLRWKAFARFLNDYSLIAEHPPESVVLWEKYLIYATALGIGEKVLQHLRKLVPQEVWERESSHHVFYGPFVFLPGRNFRKLATTASTTVAQASSGKGGGFGGGFGGGAGGFGGGSGGGRGGAF